MGFGNFDPYLGVSAAKTAQTWRKQAFSSQTYKILKLAYYHIIETTESIATKFCTVIKTTKYSSWVVQTHVQQIQDGGRSPYWKNRKIAISRLVSDI